MYFQTGHADRAYTRASWRECVGVATPRAMLVAAGWSTCKFVDVKLAATSHAKR